jgi:hypothetical protein
VYVILGALLLYSLLLFFIYFGLFWNFHPSYLLAQLTSYNMPTMTFIWEDICTIIWLGATVWESSLPGACPFSLGFGEGVIAPNLQHDLLS